MKELLRLFRWQDALDILILTFVFYRLYLWLRRKRALRMILAILALPFFYLLAQWIDLPLSVWGLQNLWAVILLVLVVIFQQEIREVLGSISLPSFFFGRPVALSSKVIDTITEVAFRMAANKIGGLIVLQRENDLDEFIHGQTPLDAELNEDILVSIFNPQSPLHDGAVILQGNRMRCATALLPVSRSLSLPKEWGTRHRAGLGITELSDAECIIISEERGEVLLASRGAVEKKERKEDLKKSLSIFSSASEEKRKGKKMLKNLSDNLPIKAVLLALVCILWIFLIGIRQGEITFNIPIEYYSIPKNLAISGEPPREVNVRLKGSQRLLSSVKPDQVRLQIDLSACRLGNNQVPLAQVNINVPSGITVSHYYPQNIRIQLSPVPATPDRKR
ncbi:MAG: diadenylate cyclase [Thermodesulfobacteriota bacterium]